MYFSQLIYEEISIDLRRQVTILFHLYKSYNEGNQDSYFTLRRYEDLLHIPNKEFEIELNYLIESGYINSAKTDVLKLSAKGVRIIELLARKFLAYIQQNCATELSYWLNVLNSLQKNLQKKQALSTRFI